MASKDVWTLGRLLDWTTGYLTEKGSEFPRLDAEVLLAHATGCQRIQLYTRFTEEAPQALRDRFKELVRRRVEGCPVAYLVGQKEFYSLAFEVNPSVLIPRPDTEVLVLETLRLAKSKPDVRLLDVGTGSGAIVIAVAKNLPGVSAWAIDISREALAVAARNADRHGVAERVHFLQSDLLKELPSDLTFDFIVSNPPYVPSDAIALLPAGVREFEPVLALDGGPGGFAIIQRLVTECANRLKPQGNLLLEIGIAQEEPVRAILSKAGRWTNIETICDYSGLPRVVRAERAG